MPRQPFVIAISGPSGAGKTTLVNLVAALLGDASTLFFDDYDPALMYPADLSSWLKDGADPDRWHTPPFTHDLHELRAGRDVVRSGTQTEIRAAKYIVVEEAFGRERGEIRKCIDVAVAIDIPLDVAMARRLLRQFSYALNEDTPREFLEFINSNLARYEGLDRQIYQAMIGRTKHTADLVLDGLRPAGEQTELILEAIRKKQAQH
jgi:uridine kinase